MNEVRIISSVKSNSKDTAENALSKELDWCDRAIFVSAFFKETIYVKVLLNAIKPKKVKLVVSLRPPTCPDALDELLAIAYKHEGSVEMRYLGSELHSKIYALEKGDPDSISEPDYWAMIGSSNMTKSGFSKNIETNVIMSGAPASYTYRAGEQIFEQAYKLTAPVLEQYRESLKSHCEGDEFDDIKPVDTDLPDEYVRVHEAVSIIRHICAEPLVDIFNQYPKSFVVDHFWHYIVTEQESSYIINKIKSMHSEKAIQELFRQFSIWCKQSSNDYGFKYLDDMVRKSRRLQSLINVDKKLSISDIENIILTFHASNSSRNRKGYDNYQSLIKQNSPKLVHQYFRALADKNVSFGKRLQVALDSKAKIKGIGESSIQEFNGWMYPEEYCIWNKKTEKAMEKLGLTQPLID